MNTKKLLEERCLQCPECEADALSLVNEAEIRCGACAHTMPLRGQQIISTEKFFDVDKWEEKSEDFDLLERRTATLSNTGRVLFETIDKINGPRIASLLDKLEIGEGLALNFGGGADQIPGFYNVDLGSYLNVDIVSPLGKTPFKDSSVSLIASNSALEHIYEFNDVVDEAFRILRTGGYFYLCVPNYCMRHHTDDYHRWTMPGLLQLVEDSGFTVVDSGYCRGPIYALSLHVETLIVLKTKKGLFREMLRVVWRTISRLLHRMDFANSPVAIAASQTIYVLVRK